jgi:hypothetical protein
MRPTSMDTIRASILNHGKMRQAYDYDYDYDRGKSQAPAELPCARRAPPAVDFRLKSLPARSMLRVNRYGIRGL